MSRRAPRRRSRTAAPSPPAASTSSTSTRSIRAATSPRPARICGGSSSSPGRSVGLARPPGRPISSGMSNEESNLRELVELYAQAVRARDAETLAGFYVEDVVAFDVVGPLQRRGVKAVRKRAEEWLAQFQGPLGYEIRDLRLDVAENQDIAFSSSLHGVDGRTRDGREVKMWIRVTVGYRKLAGEWRITHEHVSVPFDAKTM